MYCYSNGFRGSAKVLRHLREARLDYDALLIQAVIDSLSLCDCQT